MCAHVHMYPVGVLSEQNQVMVISFCVEKKGKKDKEQTGEFMKMSEIETDEKKNADTNTDLEGESWEVIMKSSGSFGHQN